ncbi:hypothetical protein EVAR_91364_1 [Eumeta japonica]|uniref:Tudor domain-containing protein n=1 Tax=Eumeta variegata TaxID=151549 RepID=A0A4C1SPD5_EUMVA|nr:hypothetical protein EVAR_91364_1 [Eumeta japonica]
MLYRAEILENFPDIQKATIRLIDYGNELRVAHSKLFPPIPIMLNLNSYAFRVSLPNECGPVEIEGIITIKILGEMQRGNYYNVECKMKSISLQLPIELFNKEHTLKFVKCFVNGRNALLRLYSDIGISDQELDLLLNSPEGLNFELESIPTVGAFVAARTQYGWKRARVLGFHEKQRQFLIYAIDDDDEKLKSMTLLLIFMVKGDESSAVVASGAEEVVARRDLRKPTLFACSLPVRCFRVTLMFLENIPTPVANNKALEALENCMKNFVEFDVTYNENKAVDLLFRTKEKQSLCKSFTDGI